MDPFLPPGAITPPTILIVDDEADVLDAIHAILTGQGYHVMKAHDGREAWTILEQTPIDLLITDVRMIGRSPPSPQNRH